VLPGKASCNQYIEYAAASNIKFIGLDVIFDEEGGSGSWHRCNPVRQYNKDKPQKYQVDFFIIACSKTYIISMFTREQMLPVWVFIGQQGNYQQHRRLW
jgi:ribonucleotide reductase beta subunit family protein with ferritin-like domain